MTHIKIKSLVLLSMYLATALILSYIESFIPILLPVPGAKLGLPNIMTLVCLNSFGFFLALLLTVSRVFISGFLFGSMSSILFSLAGGIVSVLVMGTLLKLKKKSISLSFIAISIIGAISHNLSQLVVAALVVQSFSLFIGYLPYLIVLAIPTGIFTGFTSKLLILALKKARIFPPR